MARLSPRQELIKIQKRIFRKNQALIQDAILINEKDFIAYEQNYLSHVQRFKSVANVVELKFALEDATWIYMGDYHTNRQSQRALLRVLKLLITRTDQFIICLEFLQKKHQKYVDKYLKGKIKTATLLKHLDIRKYFHFDLWENFEPIFEFAKYYQIDIYGIESAPFGSGLQRRDEAMAINIAELADQNPGYKILTFVGDLHIAPENLPDQISKTIGEYYHPDEELFLYQNSEAIYWQLAEEHLEHQVDLVRLDEKSFCLMNTPPIVWQQSYLNWLENEEGEFNYDDPKHNFLVLAERIAKFLSLKLPKVKEEVEVFTCGDLSFLERLKEDDIFTERDQNIIKHQVKLSESYYIPKRKWVYLGNMSLNHAAEEATHFIRHLMMGPPFIRRPEDAFYASVLQEALAFFGSKIINAKRKCLRLEDFKAMIEYFKKKRAPADRRNDLETALGVVALKEKERQGIGLADPEALWKQRDLFFSLSHALGYMLGEILYHALLQQKLKKSRVRSLFKSDFLERGEPLRVYLKLIEEYRGVSLPYRL